MKKLAIPLIIIIGIALVITALLLSHGPPKPGSIVGTWRLAENDQGEKGIIEFKNDGTMRLIDEKKNQEITGRFCMAGKDRIIMEIYGNDNQRHEVQMTLVDDELILGSQKGSAYQSMRFRRVGGGSRK